VVGLAEIIVSKHRNGAVGDVQLKFKSEFAKFMNKDDYDPEDSLPGNNYQVIASKINGSGGDNHLQNPIGPGAGDVPF
jgi:replicative DNA helicase